MLLANILKFPFQFILRIIVSGLNQRSIVGLVLNFWANFSLVFIWLLMFKNAGIVPDSWRPEIHVRLAKNLDEFMFSTDRLSGWLTFTLLLLTSFIVYSYFYELDLSKYRRNTIETSNMPIEFDEEESIEMLNLNSNKTFTDNIQTVYFPINCLRLTPVFLIGCSWVLLNFEHMFLENIVTYKDLVAWFSYVLLHFFSPLFTAIWLYVFHTPGALKSFGLCLGIQNICGVITHMVFPNAPPWFIHLYGEDAQADYSMPGYAAGLTRVDVALGTHLNSSGFHKSPIVFGALPSLHSAMAVCAFLYVAYYSRWWTPKVGMFMFVNLQWWATMYLDHHWRLDLIVGMFYAIITFTCFQARLRRIEKRFVVARSRGDFAKGSTMGMRVFRNTFLQDFFDPYCP